jgi:hypothetical protein
VGTIEKGALVDRLGMKVDRLAVDQGQRKVARCVGGVAGHLNSIATEGIRNGLGRDLELTLSHSVTKRSERSVRRHVTDMQQDAAGVVRSGEAGGVGQPAVG